MISIALLSGSGLLLNQDFSNYTQAISGSDLSIDLVAIEGAAFTAGSPTDEIGRDEDEGPLHQVEVSDFWMSTLEITWDQFTLFLYREIDGELVEGDKEVDIKIDGISGATMPYVNFNKPGYPIINVTQYAAATFCKWLTAKTGHFYRLPTEAEWEYAARANNAGAYAFEPASLDEYAWHAGNANDELQKGAQKKANTLGLYDMNGNAAEWVLDSYDANYYQKIKQSKNPVLFNEALYPRVVRGGSFKDEAKDLRSAARQFSTKQWKKRDPQIPKSLWWLTDATHVGFRIVRPKNVPPMEEWENIWGKPIEEY